jgi:transaldolase
MWCDFLSRDLLRSGKLDRMIELGVRGVTTNPSIFEIAIGKTSDYDDDIREMNGNGMNVEQIYTALTVADVREGADRFLPVFESSDGGDGFVSLEVSPLLCHDEEGTVQEAERLFSLVSRKNVMIKIPATPAGMGAIRRCIALGINVNATLIFSREQYRSVAEAWLSGLEERVSRGDPVTGIASVASLFVSRVDTAVDKILEKSGAKELAGKLAVDNARAAYADFEKIVASDRWSALSAQGALVQRPLWASTGTKNPSYSPTLYVDSLIGPHTVNTLPPATLEAFLESGTAAYTVSADREEGTARLAHLSSLGIDLGGVMDTLLKEGLEAFEKAYATLLEGIEKKGNLLSFR